MYVFNSLFTLLMSIKHWLTTHVLTVCIYDTVYRHKTRRTYGYHLKDRSNIWRLQVFEWTIHNCVTFVIIDPRTKRNTIYTFVKCRIMFFWHLYVIYIYTISIDFFSTLLFQWNNHFKNNTIFKCLFDVDCFLHYS